MPTVIKQRSSKVITKHELLKVLSDIQQLLMWGIIPLTIEFEINLLSERLSLHALIPLKQLHWLPLFKAGNVYYTQYLQKHVLYKIY